jgi:hypothetical protein
MDSDHDGSSECSMSAKSTSSADISSRGGSYHFRWTAADDEKLLELMETYANSSRIWKDVSYAMTDKTSTQCRTRWNYKLNPKRKRPIFESNGNEEENPSDYKKKMNQLRPQPLEGKPCQLIPCTFTMNELVDIFFILNDSGFQ